MSYIQNNVLYTGQCPIYRTVSCIQESVLYSVHRTLSCIQDTALYTGHCPVYSVLYTVSCIQCPVYSVLYTVSCIQDSVLCIGQCPVYSVLYNTGQCNVLHVQDNVMSGFVDFTRGENFFRLINISNEGNIVDVYKPLCIV